MLSEVSLGDYSDFSGELQEDWEAFYNEWQNLDSTMAWNLECYTREAFMNECQDFDLETISQNMIPSSLGDSIEEDKNLINYNYEYQQLLSPGNYNTSSTPSSARNGDCMFQSSPPRTTSTPSSIRAGDHSPRSSSATAISTPLTNSMMANTASTSQQYNCGYCNQSFDRRHKLK